MMNILWVNLMESCNEVPNNMFNHFQILLTQYSLSTAVFHFSKSNQYLSGVFRPHQQNYTIIAQTSCASTYQQNSMEKKNLRIHFFFKSKLWI